MRTMVGYKPEISLRVRAQKGLERLCQVVFIYFTDTLEAMKILKMVRNH